MGSTAASLSGASRAQVCFAFDLGDIVRIDRALELLDIEQHIPFGLPLNKPSFVTQPVPVSEFTIEGAAASRTVSVFHFGTISIRYEFSLEQQLERLEAFAESLAETIAHLRSDAEAVARELYQRMRPAIIDPLLSPIIEEVVTYWLSNNGGERDWKAWAQEKGVLVTKLVRLSEVADRDPAPERVGSLLESGFSWHNGDYHLLTRNGALLINVSDERALALIEYVKSLCLGKRVMRRIVLEGLDKAYHSRRTSQVVLRRLRSLLPQDQGIQEIAAECAYLAADLELTLEVLSDPYLREMQRKLVAVMEVDELQETIDQYLEVLNDFAELESGKAPELRNELWAVVGLLLAYVTLDTAGVTSALEIFVWAVVIVLGIWLLRWGVQFLSRQRPRD